MTEIRPRGEIVVVAVAVPVDPACPEGRRCGARGLAGTGEGDGRVVGWC